MPSPRNIFQSGKKVGHACYAHARLHVLLIRLYEYSIVK
jgi:hypothetical protein